MSPVRVTVTTRRAPSRTSTSPLVLIYAFAVLITIGTILLLLPFMHHGSGITPFVDALFTATSAATVTGLIVQDTATYWNRSGQVVIMGLMFVGGLGFMSITTFLLVLFGQRVSLSQRVLVRESMGFSQLGGLVRLTVRIVIFVVLIQIIGFVALFIRFSFYFSPAEAIFQAAFHAVSGFNNAGFAALPNSESLSAFQLDRWLLSTLGLLILIGGIGYPVIIDLVRFRRFSLMSLNTKLVLTLSLILVMVGMIVFFVSEYESVDTLRDHSVGDKVMLSTFQSINRTSGFQAVSFEDTQQHTNFFYTGLMFIGGASASVAGGIKVNTFAVVLVAVLSTIRSRTSATAFGRVIPQTQVRRALTVGAIATGFVFVVALVLTFVEDEILAGETVSFIDLFFESVSAFGTSGLSSGVTSELSRVGQVIIMITMFLGKIGPLTVALTMVARGTRDIFKYAEERITIG